MPITATFTVKEHEEYGELGLAMDGRSWAEPLSGMAVAHDMLEHFPRDRGTTEEELMALGASLYVRDGGGYFANKGQYNTDPGDNIAADMVQQCYYRQQNGEGSTLRDPGRTCKIDDEWIESCIQKAYSATRKLMRSEFDGERDIYAWTADKARFVGWLRRGYRKALKRFHGESGYHMTALFTEIENAADNFLRHASEGYECRITADVRRGRVKLTDTTDFGNY